MSGPRRRKAPPKPIHLLYGILALAALGWFAFYLRGGCRKPEMDAGQRFEKRGEWAKAVERYQALLRRYPNDHEAAARIADIQCLHLGDDEQCLAWTTRLLEIYLLRELYQATGDGAKAEVWRAKADALAPK